MQFGDPYTPAQSVKIVNGILVVNKSFSLPESYPVCSLLPEFTESFERMKKSAAADGAELVIRSGFRSYGYQKALYEKYVECDGTDEADKYSARPGHSEHQTGLAADICRISGDFALTREGIWLSENCHRFGFVIRYPKGKESFTGYIYEPWHIRYLGAEVAEELFCKGICLEELFCLPSFYGYDYKK